MNNDEWWYFEKSSNTKNRVHLEQKFRLNTSMIIDYKWYLYHVLVVHSLMTVDWQMGSTTFN